MTFDFQQRGVVAIIVRDGRFLVIRRSAHVVAPGRLCFPGGAIEPGESERDALVRELREELALEVQPLRRLWQSTTPWNVAIAWWEAASDAAQPIVPNPAEVESFDWLTREQLQSDPDLLASNRAMLEEVRRGAIQLSV